MTEDDSSAATVSGTLVVTDSDTELTEDQRQLTAQAGIQGTYGTFTLEADGTWSYALDNEDPQTNALVGGETVTDTFAVASADGTVGEVVITVTGSNDTAVIGGATTGAVTEDDSIASTAGGTLTVIDPDARQDEMQAQDGTPGRYGHFTLETDGNWRYVLDDYAADALTAGQRVVDVFTVASADGTESVVVITVTGANDAAHVSGGTAVQHESVDVRFERGPVVTVNQPLTTSEGSELQVSVDVVPHGPRNALFGDVKWDLDGDGVFGDRVGTEFTLTWEQLEFYGFTDDGDGYAPIVAEVYNLDEDGNRGHVSYTAFNVTITNTPPEIAVSGSNIVRAEAEYTLNFSAFDPVMTR